MNRFLLLILLPVLLSFGAKPGDSLFDILFTTLEGEEISMGLYENQKVLIVVLPGQVRQSDTTLLRKVGEIGLQYRSQVKVLAVPANEDGFTPTDSLVQWYHSYLDSTVVVTGAMNTASTEEQSPLFAWLTKAEQNGSFQEPVSGAGDMFFIKEGGELVAFLAKETVLNESLLERLIAL